MDADFAIPPLVLERVKVRSENRQLVDTWEIELNAA